MTRSPGARAIPSLALALGLALPGLAAAQDDAQALAGQLEAQLKVQPKTRGLVPVEPQGTCATRGLVIAPCTDMGTGGTESPVTVVPDSGYQPVPADLAINIRINFDFDSSALRTSETPKLGALCEAMKTVDVKRFQVVGHTDAVGPADYNRTLSRLRAVEVVRWLTGSCGIDPKRLEAIGVGEAFPYDKINTRSDANRRVEFQALY